MKRTIILTLLLLFSIAGVVFAQQDDMSSQQEKSAIYQRFEAANKWLNLNNLSVTNTQQQAFINDYVLVAGEGLPSPASQSPAQRRLTAIRAATIVAYRQLAEFLDGFSVVGDTMVRDAALQYDVIRSAVSGFVKGAQVVYEEYNDQEGVAIVLVKIGMTGPQGFGERMYDKLLGNADIKNAVVHPSQIPAYKHKPVPLDEKYDGLVIDATEQNFRPALINRIFTVKGDIIYDPSKVSQKVLVEQGCGEYTNSVDKAKAALASRGVKNPLLVKAVGTVSASDLQVSDDDAVTIYSANQKGGFFAAAKVAFVLK